MQAPGDGAKSLRGARVTMAFNQRIIDYCRTFVICAAAVLGLTGTASSSSTNAVLSVGLFKVAGDAKPFSANRTTFGPGIWACLSSSWTLFYDIVCANGARTHPFHLPVFARTFAHEQRPKPSTQVHLLVDGRARTACCRWRNEVRACEIVCKSVRSICSINCTHRVASRMSCVSHRKCVLDILPCSREKQAGHAHVPSGTLVRLVFVYLKR